MESDPELDPELDPDPLVRGTDPGIRIRTKMSQIPNTFCWSTGTRVLSKCLMAQRLRFHNDVDLQHVDAALAFHSYAGPDPNFYFDANPDPAPHQGNTNLKPLAYKPSTSTGSLFNFILGFQSS
jgi:hypothetical protein